MEALAAFSFQISIQDKSGKPNPKEVGNQARLMVKALNQLVNNLHR